MAQGDKPTGIGAYAQKAILKHLKVKKLEAQLKIAKQEAGVALQNVCDVLSAQGLDLIHYRDFTVYLNTQDHASLVDDENGTKDGAQAALKAADLGWLIKPTVNPKTLSAWIREQPEDEKTMERVLPEALKPWVKVFRKTEARIKKKP